MMARYSETPLLSKEGWLRPSRKFREATFAGADGVVRRDRPRSPEGCENLSPGLSEAIPGGLSRAQLVHLEGVRGQLGKVLLVFLGAFFTTTQAFAQTPDALFQSRCAQCHSANNAVSAPLPETLRGMSWQS